MLSIFVTFERVRLSSMRKIFSGTGHKCLILFLVIDLVSLYCCFNQHQPVSYDLDEMP